MSEVHPDAVATSFPALLRTEHDDVIRAPLWEFAPHERKAVISERRRRFGVDDDEGLEIG
ncbi:hypothetical protein OHA38_20375 [Streptomyces sp. NBC_01732]|uniref:hypothetical protein n=1 Tax=Streptomyces sp. NBC_01732 TaxID=2975926 RepID=UPI00352C6D9D|nr:hypothetical protein OHA38_20375 [Streptomyces sp. NBC_01732]